MTSRTSLQLRPYEFFLSLGGNHRQAGSGADRRQAPAASSQQPARRSAGEPHVPRLVPFVRRGRFLIVLRLLPAATRDDQISWRVIANVTTQNSFFPRSDRSSLTLCSRVSFALMYFIHRILLLVVAVASLARGADEGVSGSADGDSGSSRGIPIVLTPWKVRFAYIRVLWVAECDGAADLERGGQTSGDRSATAVNANHRLDHSQRTDTNTTERALDVLRQRRLFDPRGVVWPGLPVSRRVSWYEPARRPLTSHSLTCALTHALPRPHILQDTMLSQSPISPQSSPSRAGPVTR